MKTLLIATSLLVTGTSATLAQGALAGDQGYGLRSGQTYTDSRGYHDPAFVRGYYDVTPGFAAPDNYSGTASGQPSPSSGIEAERG